MLVCWYQCITPQPCDMSTLGIYKMFDNLPIPKEARITPAIVCNLIFTIWLPENKQLFINSIIKKSQKCISNTSCDRYLLAYGHTRHQIKVCHPGVNCYCLQYCCFSFFLLNQFYKFTSIILLVCKDRVLVL